MSLLIFSVLCAWHGERIEKEKLVRANLMVEPKFCQANAVWSVFFINNPCGHMAIITYITEIVFLCVQHNMRGESITCTDKFFATDLFTRTDFDKRSRLLQICVLPLIFAVLLRILHKKTTTTKPWCINWSRAVHFRALIEYLNLYYLIFVLLFSFTPLDCCLWNPRHEQQQLADQSFI